MNSLDLITSSVLLILLGLCAYCDMKNRTIPIVLIIGIFACGAGFQAVSRQMDILEIASGCGIGVVILGIAYLSKQKIGYGDGLLLIATGVFLGFMGNLWLLMIALFISMIIGVCMLTINRLNKKTAIPFAPCILCGYIGLMVLR